MKTQPGLSMCRYAAFALMLIASCTYAQTFTVLKEFAGSDGAGPQAGLVLDNGILYGTTFGLYNPTNQANVFRLTTNGSGFSVLHSFASSPFATNDGAQPAAGLLLDKGVLYGTTSQGGVGGGGVGTIFRLLTDGSGYSVVKSGVGAPLSRLSISGNTLYGTSRIPSAVFQVSADGSGFTYVHYLSSNEGSDPYRGVLLTNNVLYGTMALGGMSNSGTIFRVNSDGSGFTVLKHFLNNPDGAQPWTDLVLSGNALFGTTHYGGAHGIGTIFTVNTDGTGYAILRSFSGADGAFPTVGLCLSGTVLYGTAYNGGMLNAGTIFKLNTDGTGFAVLHNFANGIGANPDANLILSGSVLYGTTKQGGSLGLGTVFKLDLSTPLFSAVVINQMLLTWTNSIFVLQSAPDVGGIFTNIPNAVSPFTNTIAAPAQFFRLQMQ